MVYIVHVCTFILWIVPVCFSCRNQLPSSKRLKSVFNTLIFEIVICRGKVIKLLLAKGFWFYKYAFNSVSIKLWLLSFFCSTLTDAAAGWFLLWSQESRDVTVPLSWSWPGQKTCPLLNSQKHSEVQTHLNNHSYGCRDTPNLLLRTRFPLSAYPNHKNIFFLSGTRQFRRVPSPVNTVGVFNFIGLCFQSIIEADMYIDEVEKVMKCLIIDKSPGSDGWTNHV